MLPRIYLCHYSLHGDISTYVRVGACKVHGRIIITGVVKTYPAKAKPSVQRQWKGCTSNLRVNPGHVQ